MQTFLPYPDYARSAAVLDYRRLGKQRVECLQMLRGQWPHHPASKMWHGHMHELGIYGIIICREWAEVRGYRDSCLVKITNEMERYAPTGPPTWLGDHELHLSHQSNLVRKDPGFYRSHFPDVPDDLPYVWPV